MKYYIIAGEASGDLHGKNLMQSILKQDANAEFFIFGGDQMAAVPQTQLRKHISDMAFMGFVEVLMNLNSIRANMNFCKEDLKNTNPDVVILIDYPGFNLRIAEYAKSIGLKVVYYISPKIWAWNTKRVHKIVKFVDRMYSILPFEKLFYANYGYEVEYIGNPLKDAIEKYSFEEQFLEKHDLVGKPVLAILPGSRKMELERIFPTMLEAAKKFQDYEVVIAGTSVLPLEYYKQFSIPTNMRLIVDRTYDILKHAELAMVTSGTATLETALFRVPQVVCYKANALSVAIARLVIKVKYISLVNLIANKKIVEELIQDDCLAEKIYDELYRLRLNADARKKMMQDYDELIQLVGESGASDRAAVSIYKYLKNS